MKTLVTGATGMLGSALVRQLLARGNEVRILRRETSRLDLLGGVADYVEHSIGDVLIPESLPSAFDGIQLVYHTAATVGFDKSGSNDPYLANYQGTANVVNAGLAAVVDRLVHTSSIAALGRSAGQTEPIDETASWRPSSLNSAYAVSKHRAEMEVRRGIAEGLDAVIVNPSLIFGECRPGENTSAIIDRICKGRAPGIPVGGTNVVDVEDVASGHMLAMRHGESGERYILGGENLSWEEIIRTIARGCGVAPPTFTLRPGFLVPASYGVQILARIFRFRPVITPETARITARFFRYDSTRAVRELGYEARPFRETVARLVVSRS